MHQAALPVAINATAAGREQWVHLLPAGRVHGRDGRGPYIVRDAAAVIQATREYAGQTQLPVDYDHQVDRAAENGKPAPAAGWIKGLKAKPDGIWALIEWTEEAAAQIRSRAYRYISPVFNHRRDGTVTRLLRAGLTNVPNLDLTALASAGGTMNELAELRQLLELPEDADMPAILAAVRALMQTGQAAEPDPAAYVPIGEFRRVTAELNRTRQGVSEMTATAAVSGAIERGRLPPFLREWGVSLCQVNKPAFDDFVEKTAPAMARLFTELLPGPPPDRGRGRLTEEERAVCAALGHSEDIFLTKRGN